MKYNVGDKVRIKEELTIYGKFYGSEQVVTTMKKFLGKKARILKKGYNFYNLNIDNGKYCWTDEMLEPVNENVLDGHIQEGHHKYKKGIAKRNPIDPYSKAIGLIMAIADSYGIDKSTIHIGECECNNKNINKKEIDFINRFKSEKIAVYIQSIEENNKIVQLFKKYKKQLNTDDIDIHFFNHFNKVCYCYTFFNELGYSMNKDFYKSEGFKIISFSDIFKEGISLVEISTEDLLSELKNRINK